MRDAAETCLYPSVHSMALSRFCRSTFGVLSRERAFHSCSALEAAQATSSSGARATKGRAQDDLETWGFEDDLMEDQGRPGDDAPEPAHRFLEQQRQMLHYLRLIEHEMPKLVGAYSVYVCSTAYPNVASRSASIPPAICPSYFRRPPCYSLNIVWRRAAPCRRKTHHRDTGCKPSPQE